MIISVAILAPHIELCKQKALPICKRLNQLIDIQICRYSQENTWNVRQMANTASNFRAETSEIVWKRIIQDKNTKHRRRITTCTTIGKQYELELVNLKRVKINLAIILQTIFVEMNRGSQKPHNTGCLLSADAGM